MAYYSGIHQRPDVAGTGYRSPPGLRPCEVVVIRVLLHVFGAEVRC